uniref:Putative secreted protein n=1 Tax=Anopheles marajoara TaxID=58244 RepID=A0A2M4CAG5_9DIPT
MGERSWFRNLFSQHKPFLWLALALVPNLPPLPPSLSSIYSTTTGYHLAVCECWPPCYLTASQCTPRCSALFFSQFLSANVPFLRAH